VEKRAQVRITATVDAVVHTAPCFPLAFTNDGGGTGTTAMKTLKHFKLRCCHEKTYTSPGDQNFKSFAPRRARNECQAHKTFTAAYLNILSSRHHYLFNYFSIYFYIGPRKFRLTLASLTIMIHISILNAVRTIIFGHIKTNEVSDGDKQVGTPAHRKKEIDRGKLVQHSISLKKSVA